MSKKRSSFTLSLEQLKPSAKKPTEIQANELTPTPSSTKPKINTEATPLPSHSLEISELYEPVFDLLENKYINPSEVLALARDLKDLRNYAINGRSLKKDLEGIKFDPSTPIGHVKIPFNLKRKLKAYCQRFRVDQTLTLTYLMIRGLPAPTMGVARMDFGQEVEKVLTELRQIGLFTDQYLVPIWLREKAENSSRKLDVRYYNHPYLQISTTELKEKGMTVSEAIARLIENCLPNVR